MRFHLSEEQRAIQDTVRGTLADVWPIDRMHAFADAEADHDPNSWQALMALGLAGLMVGEAEGGAGLGLLDAALVCEVAGGAAAPGPIAAQMLAAWAMSASDQPGARALLPALLSGEAVATLVTTAGHAESARAATHFLIVDAAGVALVEAGAARITPLRSTDRTRKLSTVEVGGGPRLALFAAGHPIAERLIDAALILTAADALGGAQRCTDMAVAYAKERVQFGQPIGRFQALKLQLAHMALDVEPARALVWYAAYAWDAALPDAPRAAALAKAHLTDRYVTISRAAVAAHGGIGYTWEYGLNYWFRRAVFDRAWLGSPALHRARAADLAGW